MKVEHNKVPVTEFTPGNTYQMALRGSPLYKAEVLKFHGGCWATIRVKEVLSQDVATYFTPGMEFDIKVAEYDVMSC